jgi:hypothetical protein
VFVLPASGGGSDISTERKEGKERRKRRKRTFVDLPLQTSSRTHVDTRKVCTSRPAHTASAPSPKKNRGERRKRRKKTHFSPL